MLPVYTKKKTEERTTEPGAENPEGKATCGTVTPFSVDHGSNRGSSAVSLGKIYHTPLNF